MPAPHALYSNMLAERTASRNVLVLFYFILCLLDPEARQRHSDFTRKRGRKRFFRLVFAGIGKISPNFCWYRENIA